MRAILLAVAAMALAGCPSNGGCPVDTISSASQCIPIRDLAVPDLSNVIEHMDMARLPTTD